MHEVHTDNRRGLPPTMARTRWTLGYQRLFVRLCEWLMLMPTDGCLPQTSQTAAIEGERIPACSSGAVPGAATCRTGLIHCSPTVPAQPLPANRSRPTAPGQPLWPSARARPLEPDHFGSTALAWPVRLSGRRAQAVFRSAPASTLTRTGHFPPRTGPARTVPMAFSRSSRSTATDGRQPLGS